VQEPRSTAQQGERSTLCAFPWTHIFVDPVGIFTTCCVGDPRPHVDEDGATIRAGQKDAIARHWRSPRMRAVRRDLAAGRRHPVCDACWRVEALGSTSYRHRANEMFDGFRPEEDAPPPRIQFVDLRLGNFCNLKCRMCIPYSSKLLIPEYRELQAADDRFWDSLGNLSWFDSAAFWDDLLQYAPDFKRVHLAGGEPLAIKKAWEFLRRLIELGHSKSIELTYNTNWTVIPKWTKEIWREFRAVHLFISMDGVGKTNEFIRHPLDWDQFRENLALLEEQHEDFNVRFASIHTTAQIYNAFRLAELCEFVKGLRFIDPYPQIAIVVHPEVFDVRVLPPDLKTGAGQRILEYIDAIKHEADAAELRKQLKAVVDHMMNGDHTHLIPALRRHNEVYDRHRGERTADVLPEIAALLA
jgi:organic radical activating enzyme